MLDHRFQKITWLINKAYRGVRLYSSNGSYQVCKQLFHHIHRTVLRGPVPDLLTIGLTYRCQCNCVHCSSNVPNRNRSEELDTLQVKSIIDQAKRLGIVRITFFGGEPLMRKDLVDLVQYAHDAGILTRINTNGWSLTSDLVKHLKNAGLTLCDVSIDDPDPERHDRLRGLPGLYRKAIEGIQILKQFKIPCQIVTYASKRNVTAGLEQIIDLGRQLDVFAVSIVFPMATGCWQDSFDQLLSEEEKDRVRKLGDSKFVHIELPTPQSRCNILRKKSLYVSPEGDVTPCPFVPYAMGNVTESPLDEIWYKFVTGFNHDWSGDCPMNDLKHRNTLKSTLESTYIRHSFNPKSSTT